MTLTKVSGGILDPGINVAGIVTATGFDGPFTGGSSKNITAGIITATGLDVNGNGDISGSLTVGSGGLDLNGSGDISGNLVVHGNLTANGDFTTLNTTLREVELLRVDANSSEPAGIITQTGAGDLLRLYDGTSQVVTVDDEGKVGIGSATPGRPLTITSAEPRIRLQKPNLGHGEIYIDDDNSINLSADSSSSVGTSSIIFRTNGAEKVRIKEDKVGIGTDNPLQKLTVYNESASGTGGILVQNIDYGNNQDKPYLTVGTEDWTGATTNWNTFGFQHRIKSNSGGVPRITVDSKDGELFCIHQDGDVGIGTAIPSVKLDVAGTIKTTNITSDSSNLSIENTADRVLIKSANRIDIADNMVRFQNRAQNAALLEAVAGASGYVKLYHNNNVVASVTMDALTVTGRTNNSGMIEIASGQAANNNDRFRIHKTSAASRLTIQNYSTGSWVENIRITAGGAVELKHADGTTHFETTSTGFDGSGSGFNLQASDSGAVNLRLQNSSTGTGVNDGFLIQLDSNEDAYIWHRENQDIFFGTQDTTRWKIDNNGHLLPGTPGGYNIGSATAEIGNVYIADSKAIWIGSDQDLAIAHDPTHTVSYIQNAGTLQIQTDDLKLFNYSTADLYLRAQTNSSVDLYYDYSTHATAKLKTSATGITVHGEVEASQDYPVHKPSLDFNFARIKKLDARFTYTRTGTASYVDENGYIKVVGDNVPRFDHDPVTRESKGLLAEQSVANWIQYSANLTQTGWGENGVTHTIAATEVAPDGNTGSVSEQTDTSTNNYHATYIDMSIPMTSGQYYTISTWLKKGPNYRTDINSGNYQLYCSRGTGSVAYVSINSDFDGFVSHSNTIARSLTKYRNGWVRVTYSFQSNQNSSNTMPHWLLGNGGSYQGNGTNSVYIWGCQFEQMKFPTSYVPTNGSVVYRGTDDITLDGTELTDVFNPIEGTSVVYAHMPNENGGAGLPAYAFKNSSNSNVHLGLSRDSGSDPAYHYYHDGSNSGFSRASAATNNLYKGALSFKTSDLDSYVNGSLNTNTTTFTMPTIDTLRIGGVSGANYVGGHVARFMYYPVKLTNNQLLTLTS